jgi:hypothetical protein
MTDYLELARVELCQSIKKKRTALYKTYVHDYMSRYDFYSNIIQFSLVRTTNTDFVIE